MANEKFIRLLKQKLPVEYFQTKITVLIEQYSLFLPPYLDVLEYLEEVNDSTGYALFLDYTQQRLQALWKTPEAFNALLVALDFPTLHACKHLLMRLHKASLDKQGPDSLFQVLEVVVNQLNRTVIPSAQWHFLSRQDKMESVTNFQKELADKEHFWFANTRRQRTILHHAYTQAIILRGLVNRTPAPQALFGAHESQPTELAAFFPYAMNYVERIAQESGCGLGRVALVRLQSCQMAYRHCDREQYLIGRDRYHFVIQAKENNFLYSANEVLLAQEGQLIKYDNMVQHKPYNESDQWRVHLIFDMFPVVESPDGSYSVRPPLA